MVSGIGSPTLMPYEPTLERVDGSASNGTNATSTVVAANAHREASGDLTIKTLEGDTVTLSAHLESDATFAAWRGRGAQATYLSVESSAGFELSVEGDLSEQELQDIEKLVKQFGRELRQFFRGSPDAQATDVGRGEFVSLAGVAANFQASASLTVIAGQQQSAPAEAPAQGGVAGSPANPALPQAEDSTTAVTNGAVPDFSGLQSLVGRLQRLVSAAPMSPERALKQLGRMLDRLEDALGGDDHRRHVLGHVRRETGAPARSGRDAAESPARQAAIGD